MWYLCKQCKWRENHEICSLCCYGPQPTESKFTKDPEYVEGGRS
jgi:hypothetical protein